MRECEKAYVLTCIVLLLSGGAAAQTQYSLRSPDKRIEVRVRSASAIQYDVLLGNKFLLQNSTLSLNVDRVILGRNPKVKKAVERSQDQTLEPAIHQKSARIREHYNELRIELEDGLAVTFRAYDEGAAYRLETSLPKDPVKIYAEEAAFNFPSDFTVYYPLEESFFSHNERQYLPNRLGALTNEALATLPAVVDAGGVKVAIAESDIEDYPGMWLRGTGANGLVAAFPPFPLKEVLERDRDYRVAETADYIATTKGSRTFAWRLFGIAEKDGDLITNPLVWLLEKPSRIQDTSWIKPGKVAWDWWNANNLYGVDFKAGINTQTYKYYIDFAAKYGLQYIILDEGWYKLGNVVDVVPEIDIPELVAYGRPKNVGVILWVVWKSLADQLQPALDEYSKWGVKGIKVDFMQRDDQKLVNFYHTLAAETAKRKMLLDFHGNQRPAMMTRTWPNLISAEGVRGMEWSKWSADSNPPHNVTLPFTRMFLGPMDYTPGAMLNATKATFAPVFDRPMALGTRCQQLAMYVVFESPLEMLADSPSNYLREPEAMEFLSPIPSIWDETKVLDGKLGQYVMIARRSGQDWYIGAMTDWTARDLTLDLSFLPKGNFRMESYQDGANADRVASDYKRIQSQVHGDQRLTIHLAAGGGWAARIHP